MAQDPLGCGTGPSAGSGIVDPCDDNPEVTIDFGNALFIPNENSPVLEVLVNIWVATHEVLYSNGNDDHFTDDINHSDFQNQYEYLKSMPELANQRVWNKGGIKGGIKEVCIDDEVFENAIMPDTKIRFKLNTKSNGEPAIYYINDYSAATNVGTTAFSNYIVQHPEHQNAFNIILQPGFVSSSSGVAWNAGSITGAHAVTYGGYDRYKIGGDQWDLEAQNIVHEFNHVMFGGGHTDQVNHRERFQYQCVYSDNDYSSSLNHNMSQRGQNQIYLSELAVGQIRRMLLTTWRSKYLTSIPEPSSNKLIINDHFVVEESGVYWPGDIEINYPGRLEVIGDLFLGEDSKIFVRRGAKLVVSGGRITTCDPDIKWHGIRVEGPSTKVEFVDGNGQLDYPYSVVPNAAYAGTVWLNSGAELSNAKTAISTYNHHLGWPTWKNYYGGLIWTENGSTFANCDRAVEIMEFGNQVHIDKSRFLNTNFKNLNRGVTNWSSDGVRFDQCSFEDIRIQAIHSTDAQIFVENGNTFEDCYIGIDLNGTKMEPYQLRIGKQGTIPNWFNRISGSAVQISGVNNASPVLIINNNFHNSWPNGVGATNSNGMQILGFSNYDVRNNFFGASRMGMRTIETDGASLNNIRFNDFNRPLSCVMVQGKNNSIQLAQNCMKHYVVGNIFIRPDGILSDQGSDNQEAGNCFDTWTVPSDINNENPNLEMKYYVESGLTVEDCKYPHVQSVAGGNIQIFPALESDDTFSECGLLTEEAPEGPPSCVIYQDPELIKSEITAFDVELQNTNDDFLYSETRICLNEHLNELYLYYESNGEFEEAFLYFSNRPEFFFRTLAYQAKVESENFAEARGYLNSIGAIGLAEQNYVFAQSKLLDYLEGPDNFVLSEADELQLLNSALNTEKFSGHVASIYKLLSGNTVMYPEVPELANYNPSQERSKKTSIATDFQVYPNPNNGSVLNVQTPSIGHSYLELFDFSGNLKKRVEHNQNSALVLTEFSSGIYFIKITSNEGIDYTKKLIIQ